MLFSAALAAKAQDIPYSQPRTEKLLNGLNVLIWSRAGTGRVIIRLRVHNGAAYDQRGKEGSFAMLSDILFPEEGVKEFFKDDLGGGLEVETTYDYVEVTAEARADAFLTALETIAPALMITPIDKETTAKIRDRRLGLLKDLARDPGYRARIAAAQLLYGEFPYGRPVEGTPESVSGIDFADLIYVRERFLTADNATLEIIGDVRSDYAYLAARRLMGSWNKSGSEIPATFRLPEAPPIEPKIIYADGEPAVRTVAAVESFRRKDPLYHAAEVLAMILQPRIPGILVVNEGFLVKGTMYASLSKDGATEFTAESGARDALKRALAGKISSVEFESAKRAYLSAMAKRGSDSLRLDVDTYGLGDVRDEIERIRSLRLEDVQKAADTIAARTAAEAVVISRPAAPAEPAADPKDPS